MNLNNSFNTTYPTFKWKLKQKDKKETQTNLLNARKGLCKTVHIYLRYRIHENKTKQTQLSTLKKNFYLARQKKLGGTYKVNRCKQCKTTEL